MDYDILYYDLFCDDRILTLSAGRIPECSFVSVIGSGKIYTDRFAARDCNFYGQKLVIGSNSLSPDLTAFILRSCGKNIDAQLTYVDLKPSKAPQRLTVLLSASLSGTRITAVPARIFGELCIGRDVVPMTAAHAIQLRLSYDSTPKRLIIATAVDTNSSSFVFYAVSESDSHEFRKYCCIFRQGNALYSFNGWNSKITLSAEGQRINITLTSPSRTMQIAIRLDGEFEVGSKKESILKSVNSHLQAELSGMGVQNIKFASRSSTLNIGTLKIKSEEGQRVFAH